MKITIYQIDLNYDHYRLFCMDWSYLLKYGYKQPPAVFYQAVYTYEKREEKLDELFERFNNNHPADYTARSVSVSDVIEFQDESGTSRFYFCDNFGFVQVSFDKSMVGQAGRILTFMEDEKNCEQLISMLLSQMYSDNESYAKKGRALLEAYLKGSADDALLAICGWNTDSQITLSAEDSK